MKTMTDSMFELETVLKDHAQRYPLMQPADAVKLIYQNEFGGGHLIKNEETCLNLLHREYACVIKNPSVPLYEDIGNGFVRVNLAAVQATDLEQLGKFFIHSASTQHGSFERFLQKLDVLRTVTQQDKFSFSSESLEAYLHSYATFGFPVVSHSKQYRIAYHPAYRVIFSLNEEKNFFK